MNINRGIRNAKRRTPNGDEELYLDSSQELEDRLKKLLTEDKKKLNRPREVFNNIKKDVPKLRKSVVTRALQTYVCSTPMPTGIKRDFFSTENSLNISPISASSEKLKDDNREQVKKKQNEGKEKLNNKETIVPLTCPVIHITISDSSYDEDIEANEGSRHVKSNSKQTKYAYNTRSSDKSKMPKQITQEKENPPNNIDSQKHWISSDSLRHKDNALNQERETSKNLNSEKDTVISNIRENKSIKRKDTLSTRKRIEANSVLKKHVSSDLSSNNAESDTNNLKSVDLTRNNRSHSRPHQNEVTEHSHLESKQTKSPDIRKNTDRLSLHLRSKSPSHSSNDLIQSATNLKQNTSTNHESQVDISKGNPQNSAKANKSEKKMSKIVNTQTNIDKVNKNKSLNKNNTLDDFSNIDSQQLQEVTRRNPKQSLKETENKSPQRVSLRQIARKNNAIQNTMEIQKGLSPRKLLFLQKDENIEQTDVSDIKMKENRKSNTEITQPKENLSKIPILRSKSREISVDRNIKILRTASGELHPNEYPEDNYGSSEDNVEQIKNICAPPPKCPPRKKKNQKKKHLLGQVLESENISTIAIENLGKNADTSSKEMKNSSETCKIQNGTSPDKLEILQNKNLTKESPLNTKENQKTIKVLNNILITRETEKTLVRPGISNFESLEERPTKVYIEKGTSPLVFENEIEAINAENKIMTSDNSERIFKRNSKIPADYEEDLEKTLVEVGTSPIKFASKTVNILKNTTTPKKLLADAGTSPWNFENIVPVERDTSEADRIKTEKLNQLLNHIKLSKKNFEPPNTPGVRTNSDSRFVKVNHTVHKEIQTSTKALSECASPPRNTCREIQIQTSLRSPCRTPHRKNFSRNLLSEVVEQETQTTGSLIITNKTCKRKNKRIERKAEDANKSDSSSTTDQSEILKEVERERDMMLFQSLAKEIIPTNFSSSDDEIFEDTLQNNGSHNLPWRLDDNFPRQSKSFKLNFIRSAHEIETEQSQNKQQNNFYFSDSDSEFELRKFGKKKSDQYSQNVLGHTRKNRLQSYSRANLPNNEKESLNAQLDPPKCTDENRLSSSPSSMSDLIISESISKNKPGYQETRQIACEDGKSPILLVNELPSQLPDINFGENECVDVRPIVENANQEVISSDECNKDMRQSSTNATEINNKRSLIVVLDNDRDFLIDKRNLHENIGESTDKDNIECAVKSVKNFTLNKRTKSTKKSNNGKQQKNYESEIEDETLATPLEHSEIPQLQPKDLVDKPDRTQNLSILSDDTGEIPSRDKNSKTSNGPFFSAPQSEKTEFKVPKIQVRKAKKKVVPENDGSVSSSSRDSMDSGIRRSGRERKPPQRRFCGAIVTTSEREINYYNASLLLVSAVNSSSRPSTKKMNTTKNQKESGTKRPVIKKGRSTKKGKDQVEEELEKSNFPKKINNTDNPMAEEELPLDMPITNEADDNLKTNKGRKHHITRSTTDNSPRRTSYLTPKRSKLSIKTKNHSSIINSQRNRRKSLQDKTNKKDASTSHSAFLSENQQNSTNVDIDNNHVPNNHTTNDDGNTNYTSDGISHENMNHFATGLADEPNDYNIDSVFHNGSIVKDAQVNKLLDKDSGRSTMLKSSIFDDSNLRPSKRLTRINKKYKKRGNICNKISKVLSRSINNSREMEILNGNEPSIQTPLTKPADSEYIDLLCDNNIVSMKYVEKRPNFKVIDDLEITDVLKNSKDGGGMGFVKLAPGSQKPLHVARKYFLFYTVLEGEAFIQVHNKTSRITKYSNFIIPLGYEYSIKNVSKEESLLLSYVKVAPKVE